MSENLPTTPSPITGAAKPSWLSGILKNKTILSVVAALIAGGGGGYLARAPKPAFDPDAYRRDHALLLLGANTDAKGTLWHIGILTTNGPIEAFSHFVPAPQQAPQPATQPTTVPAPTTAALTSPLKP